MLFYLHLFILRRYFYKCYWKHRCLCYRQSRVTARLLNSFLLDGGQTEIHVAFRSFEISA